MSKALATLLAGTGASTVAVAGTFLLNKQSRQFVDNLNTFKEVQDDCSRNLFPGVSLQTLPADNNVNVGADFLGSVPTGDTSKTKSCLSIKGKTKKGEGNKLSGTFVWSWSFVNDTKGFIVFTVANTNTSNNGLDVMGGAYFLSKEGDTGSESWKVKHYKEITGSDKTISSDDFGTKFPKAKSDNSVLKIDNQDYGGFVTNSSSLSQTCDDACDKKLGNKSWSWSGKQGGSHKVSEGSEGMEWGDHIYTKTFIDLKTKLDLFTGTGEKVSN